MKIYISGKREEDVISDATREKFARAEKMLEAKGHEVFNICNKYWQCKLTKGYQSQFFFDQNKKPNKALPLYTYSLLQDIEIISFQDGVYMLEDFQNSFAALAEYRFAWATGKRMLFQEEGSAEFYLKKNFWRDAENGLFCYEKRPLNEVMEEYVDTRMPGTWVPID